jgi:hypothetical protein
LDIDGDNVTLNGSTNGDRLARVGDLNVGDGTNEQSITVQDIQEIEGGVGIQNSADLTLGLVDTDDGGVEGEIQGTFGISNGINFTSSSNGLTLTSDVEVTGGALSASNGTLDLGGNTLEVSGGNDITLDSGLDYSAGGGTLVADGGSGRLDFGGLDVENLRVEGSDATLVNGVEVSGLLDVDADVDNNGNTITLSGDAELADDSPNLGGAGNETIRGSAALEVTGSASTITAETDVSFTNLEVNTGGTVDFRTNNDQAPRIFEISNASGSFTHTQGGVSLGINDLRLAVQTSYSYSEGTYSTNATRFGIGEVVLDDSDGNADFESFDTNGNEVSIPDLTIQGSDDGYALQSSDDVLTVTGTLELERGTLNSTSNNGTVNIADGATIERNAGTLDEAPTFNSNVNVRYANRSGITSGVELPSSTDLLQTLTVEGGNEVALDKSVTVNSELSLLDGDFDVDDGGQDPRVITVVDGGTVSLGGGGLNNEDGEGSLAYNGTATLEYRNKQDINENSTPDVWPDEKTDVDLVIDGADLTIDTNDRTVASATFDTGGGDFDLDDSNNDARTLTVTGDITRESDDSGTGGFFDDGDSGNSSTVVLGGSSAQSIALPGLTEMAGVSLEMDNSEGATLSGGGLEVGGLFTLTSGVFDTGDAFIYLSGGDVSRSGGLVEGTVRHDIPRTNSTSAEVLTFPLGSPEAGTYRPITLTFDDPSNIGASGTIDADYVASGPGGANNLPLLTEDDNGNDLRIARYPDFHWTLETSTSIAPSVSYDIEAEAEGFSAFVDEDVANLRTIRRQVGSTSNQWRLLGDGPSDYNNFQSAEDYPHAVVSGVSGGLTSSGTIFSYGLESNLEAESIADQTVDEGETSTGPFLGSSATDEVDAVFDGGTGEYSYDVSSSNTDVATASAPDDTLVVEGQGAGTATITVNLTDALNDTASVSAQVDVQGAPSFTDALPDTTVTDADTLTFTYQAEDPDGDDLGYELTESPDGASIDSTSGEFSWSPAFVQAGGSYNVVARVTDGGRTALSDTAVVTVEQSLAKGDVDGDQDTTALDAAAAQSIFLETDNSATSGVDESDPTEAQRFAADFSDNGTVTPYDASLILQAFLGGGSSSAATAGKSAQASGSVRVESMEQDGNVASMPIVLSEDASGVQSVGLEVELGQDGATLSDVSTNLPDGWIADHTETDGGTVKIGMAGASPIGAGQIGTIRLKTDDASSVEPGGQYQLNAGSKQDLDVSIAPESFALNGNYPNPVQSQTTIEYELKEATDVRVSLYDALGREVAVLVDEQKSAGRFEANVDAGDLSSGVYFYRMEAGDFTATKKMTIVR